MSFSSYFGSFTSWITSTVDSAYNWLDNNISGVPLGVFSAAGDLIPVPVLGVQYYIPSNVDQDVKALFSGSQWANSTVTYSLPDSRSDYESLNPSASGFERASLSTEVALHYIFNGSSPIGGQGMKLTSLASFTNVNWVFAGHDNADIKVASFDPGDIINRSHGYYPGVPLYGGDVWIEDANEETSLGSKQYSLTLHELGHALGLKHPHDSGGNLPEMSDAHDRAEYTVMSYSTGGARPQTFMMYDIQALQLMYGADFTANSGNTVYRWNELTGETYVNGESQGTPVSNKILLTIWDGGGIDTYDLSNYSAGVTVDLAPGGYSFLSAEQISGAAHGNVYNALQYNGDSRSLIENAIGGAGDDQISGNDASNMLVGNAGNDVLAGLVGNDTLDGGYGDDVLNGGAGDDTLIGGAGADIFDGGSGWNQVSYQYAASGIRLNLWDPTDATGTGSKGDASGDRFTNIQTFVGTEYADSMVGLDDATTFYGGRGNDLLHGFGGDDLLAGQGDNDTLYGGAGNDTLYGDEGNDRLYGEAGSDYLDGGYGADSISGGDGSDRIFGRFGNDTLDGGEGSDVLDAGEDDDLVYGQGGDDYIIGFTGHDYLFGMDGNDTVLGGDGNDYMTGHTGHDELHGGNGNDTVHGDAGNDYLDGAAGADALYGGADADTLYGRFGNDTLDGGEGDDLIDAGEDDDLVYGRGGNDKIIGYTGHDYLFGMDGNDTVDGGDGNDYIGGYIGHDRLFGGAGNDSLFGEDGNDSLDGGAGDDVLWGGAGADLFVIDASSGRDVIKDFGWGDVLRLTGVMESYSNWYGLSQNKPYSSGSNTIITTMDGRMITLEGIVAWQLKGGVVNGAWEWHL